MRIKCEKNILDTALNVVGSAINNRSPLPILSHVKIIAKNDRVDFIGTNLDQGIIHSCDAVIEDSGAVTCNYQLLKDFVSRSVGGEVTLESQENQKLKISTEQGHIQLASLPPEEFPSVPKFENEPALFLPFQKLEQMVKQVSIAVAPSGDETRPVYTGIRLLMQNNILELIGTDARRLAIAKFVTENNDEYLDIIVPAKALANLSRVFRSEVEKIAVGLEQNQVFFFSENTFYHCRLLDGHFPDHNQAIPVSFERTCRIPKDSFIRALSQVILVAQDKISPNLVRFKFEPNLLHLMTNTPEIGSAEQTISVDLEGDELEIAFNGSYIMEALKVIEEEEVEFFLQDSQKGACLKPNDSDGFSYVVMPIKLRQLV